jgi:hypothetical protein
MDELLTLLGEQHTMPMVGEQVSSGSMMTGKEMARIDDT